MAIDFGNPTQDTNEEEKPQQSSQSQGFRKRNEKERRKNSPIDDIKTVKRVYSQLTSNPTTKWVIFAIVGFFMIVIFHFFSGGGGVPIGGTDVNSPQNPVPNSGGASTPPIPGFTITLTGPTSVDNGKDISYTVTTHYDPATATTPLSDIELYDQMPKELSFVSTTGTLKSSSALPPTWSLSKNDDTFKIVLHPSAKDVNVTYTVGARIASGAGSGIAANSNNCNGAYDLTLNPNFGDPNCTLITPADKDKLFTLLQQLDPSNANKWYMEIIPCESGYNPNAYLRASQSGLGAYGLFQMNPSGRGNAQSDAGDVSWNLQASNAVKYNSLINGSFAYWACAK